LEFGDHTKDITYKMANYSNLEILVSISCLWLYPPKTKQKEEKNDRVGWWGLGCKGLLILNI
jgi:hypothetical protein